MPTSPLIGVRPAGWIQGDGRAQTAGLVDFAVHADRLGFDVVYVGERLLATAGRTDLKVYEAPMLEPFVLLAAIAARTERIRLAPLVTVVPFRHPAQLAKITASLDVLSDGRFILGAGAGWSQPEIRMFGTDPRRRGAQMEEGIRIVRELWTGEAVDWDGEFWTLRDVRVTPTPVQKPGPDVWLASFQPDDATAFAGTMTGGQRRALERIGRIADGWAPLTYSAGHKMQLRPEQLGLGWEIIHGAAVAAGREPDAVDILYPHWIEIIETKADRAACERALARFFPGTWEDAVRTYLIGTADEIAERIAVHTARLPRVDGYLFTSISERTEQLDALSERLRPLLPGGRTPRASIQTR